MRFFETLGGVNLGKIVLFYTNMKKIYAFDAILHLKQAKRANNRNLRPP